MMLRFVELKMLEINI